MTEFVIWDWNGTLLDDVDFNRRATNQLLVREGVPEMPTVERYRELFERVYKRIYPRLKGIYKEMREI